MKVFIVMRSEKVDQVFFNTDPAIARAAAEARARELNAKWAITRVVEQAVIVPEAGPVLADVSAKLAYEWVRTGHWNLNKFTRWLDAKQLKHGPYRTLPGGLVVYQTSAGIAYDWVRTKHWGRRAFQTWLNSLL